MLTNDNSTANTGYINLVKAEPVFVVQVKFPKISYDYKATPVEPSIGERIIIEELTLNPVTKAIELIYIRFALFGSCKKTAKLFENLCMYD